MPQGIIEVNSNMPAGIPKRGTVRDVTWKSMADRVMDARIRAYLREYMADREIGQVELAERLDVSQGNVSKILSRERGIGLGLALKISRLLRVSMPRLLEENPPDKFWDAEDLPGRGR